MADIFLSYAREDLQLVKRLAAILGRRGWSLFWDRVIPVGKSWDRVLEEELPSARAITPVWSAASVKSDWVIIEASEGVEDEKLFPVLIEEVKPPRRFRLVQWADLVGWDGEENHPQLDRLVSALTGRLGAGTSTSGVAAEPGEVQARGSVGPEGNGHDAFLAYAAADREKAAALAGVLEQHGIGVWWDRRLLPGESWAGSIEEALEKSRAVIVLWSEVGVRSDWVRAEADFAIERGIMLPVLIEPIEVPFQYRMLQARDLREWEGDADSPEMVRLLESVEGLVGRPVRRELPLKERLPSGERAAIPGRVDWRPLLLAFLAGLVIAAAAFWVFLALFR